MRREATALKSEAKIAEAPANAPDAKPIQFIDLKAQQHLVREQVEERFKKVLDHGAYVNGPEIAELEEKLADYTGAADVVAVASGTDALVIAMMGEGIGAGDAVFVPGFTYNATANAVLLVGAEPVFVDVERSSCNLDPQALEDAIRRVKAEGRLKPRAVVPVDLFGLPADYESLNAVAETHDLSVIADAAQSFGGEANGRKVGSLASISGTSFFPAKALGCYGDGGALFTTDAEKGEIWRSIRWHGTDPQRRESVRVGFNGRMDTMQAAVLLEKLSIFGGELTRRREVAARYETELEGYVGLLKGPEGVTSGYGLFTILVEDRDRVREALTELSIPTAVYYLQSLPQMEAFRTFAPEGGLPNCEWLTARVLSLPMHPYLADAQVERVCDAVQTAVRR